MANDSQLGCKHQSQKQEEYPDNGSGRRTRGEFLAAELALVLNHAVYVGIYRGPITGLHFSNKTGKHFTDVFLMPCIDGGREFVGGTIPRNCSILLMRKHTHRLPAISQQDIACKYLFYAEAIIRLTSSSSVTTRPSSSKLGWCSLLRQLYHLMGSTRQRGKR